MAGILQHLRSSTLDKRPNPGSMVDGQVAINYASGSPGLFFKDNAGALVKVGPVHVGTTAPNVSPASGGTAGNSRGEQWLDTSGGGYVMKIWDGSAWRTEAGEFVNATGDIMTGALGMPPASAGSPTIYFSGDTDTGLYSPGANQLAITTSGTGRLFVASDGKVGIGTSAPNVALDVNGSIRGRADNSYLAIDDTQDRVGLVKKAGASPIFAAGSASSFIFSHSSGTSISDPVNQTYSERARIDSSGRLLVGTSTSLGSTSKLIEAPNNIAISAYINNAYGYELTFNKSRGSINGTIVQNGDNIGNITWRADDGTDTDTAAALISAYVDGTPGTNDMPGRLVFSTTADGASSPTERMRISSTGSLHIGNANVNANTAGFRADSNGRTDHIVSSDTVSAFNRTTNDGTIISLRQDDTEQGTISVSGTTVTLNGAHLSRWSQLPSGAERTEILRGTVLSNIDEMCEWGEEENEQLNRMKVSDVEGDKNVSGVFQSWDDDDDIYTNDFYCAMTGDFIIRIGAGVTVERGDLLMSAGDGTAKPQDDDIIRSKTIAKVTSTNVTCAYDDGSYCVPCVLMAC